MNQLVRFVIAEDDEDDRFLIREALEESALRNPYTFVQDGVELLDFLTDELKSCPRGKELSPMVILLDLNMPRMDGREALLKLKTDPIFRLIPVVVLTTSKSDEDIVYSYQAGVNSFVTKPVSFEGLVSVVAELKKYWVEVVALPSPGHN
tara:strand:+ start:2607 stop:3056 length:450 start_codon:yes stop_codon:yes gene_type:complete